MSMMFNALRALEMEQRETRADAFLSNVHLSASTVSADDFSAGRAGQRALKGVPTSGNAPKGRSKMYREQLEALRSQVEEDYQLDIAAIERFLQRYAETASLSRSSAPGRSTSPATCSQPGEWADPQPRTGPSDLPLPLTESAEQRVDEPGRSVQANVQRRPQASRRQAAR